MEQLLHVVPSFSYIIIDFDSTIIQVEALDELADIVLEKNPSRKKIVKK